MDIRGQRREKPGGDDVPLGDGITGEGGREDALEAAGHVGNPEIAQYLLDQGMPLTVFAAAVLRREADVRRFLAENPALATPPECMVSP